MSLHLEVICEPNLSIDEREMQTVQVIGELIPFVLAKYIAGNEAAANDCFASSRVTAPGSRRRFEIQ